jgi:gamma-glutamyl:cysteine ligase YbdK (ATP-grasp superfamily)
MIDSMKDLHWDIRPSPRFGTVEVRVMDTRSLAQAINIAGFIQTLACWLLTERPFKHQPDDYLLYPLTAIRPVATGWRASIPMFAAASSAASRGDYS